MKERIHKITILETLVISIKENPSYLLRGIPLLSLYMLLLWQVRIMLPRTIKQNIFLYTEGLNNAFPSLCKMNIK